MIQLDQIRTIIENIPLLEIPRTLGQMNLLKNIESKDQSVSILLNSTGLAEESQTQIQKSIQDAIAKVDGGLGVEISFEAAAPKDINVFGKIIAVMSGKGGVGKSLVSGLSAIALRRAGFEVGILDADITGPSIPKMFGIKTRPSFNANAMLPVISKTGIEIMSLNLLLPNEEEAVIWRGPIIGQVITQFWEEVLWGKLDYLIIDLPPGTADAPLTILQKVPVSGIIMVTTPQELTTMIVKKAVKMAKQMNKPVIGVIENMSYLYVKEIDKKIELFGHSRGEEMAQAAGAPLIAQIPIDPELAKLCDQGKIERYKSADIERLGDFIAKTQMSCNTACTSDCKSCGCNCES